jgi:hypothetical protein
METAGVGKRGALDIDTDRRQTRDHYGHNARECLRMFAALQTALDKGKLEDEELTQAQIGLDSLQKTLVSLEAEQNYQENLKEVLTKASSKLEPIFTGVIKSLRDTLQQKAFTEAARAAVGEPAITRSRSMQNEGVLKTVSGSRSFKDSSRSQERTAAGRRSEHLGLLLASCHLPAIAKSMYTA